MAREPRVCMFRERPQDNPGWLTLCARPVPDTAISVELAWDAPHLMPLDRLCSACVRRFHRIRRPPAQRPQLTSAVIVP